MNDDLLMLIKELGLTKRIDVLRYLRCQPAPPKEIRRYFEANKHKISVGGLSKCLNGLANCGLVEKIEDGYAITGWGMLLFDVIEGLGRLHKLRDEFIDAEGFMEIVPVDLKMGLTYLRNAKIERDVYVAVHKAMNDIRNAKRWAKYICNIHECTIFRTLVRNHVKGVKERMISSKDTVETKIDLLLTAIIEEKLGDREITLVMENFELRVFDAPVQLAVIDGKIAYIQIQKHDRHSPIYYSEDRDFVRWVNALFDFFWEIAKPAKIPYELLRRDLSSSRSSK